MTTEDQIKALQGEVEELRETVRAYHGAVTEWRARLQGTADEMRQVARESTQRFIPAVIQHQLVCAVATVNGLECVEDTWGYAQEMYEEGVRRGIYPKESP